MVYPVRNGFDDSFRLKAGGVLCPDVVILKKHILVMSFIGSDQCPAPKLKDIKLSSGQWKNAYGQVFEVSVNDCCITSLLASHLVHVKLCTFFCTLALNSVVRDL